MKQTKQLVMLELQDLDKDDVRDILDHGVTYRPRKPKIIPWHEPEIIGPLVLTKQYAESLKA